MEEKKLLKNYCTDGSMLTIRRNVAHEDFPFHSHNFTELVIVLSGSALHKTNNRSFAVDVGSVFMVAPDEEHGYEVFGNNFGMINIIFDQEKLLLFDIKELPEFYRLFSAGSASCLTQAGLKKVQVLIENMEAELKKRHPGYQAVMAARFLEILVEICRHSLKKDNSVEDPVYDNIHKLMSWLEVNFREKITLDKMAKIAGMSKRNFQRTFSKIAILSPTEHLIRLRLDKAAEQLRFTNKQISSIAIDCGFSDSNYFSRCFKKHRGCSPLDYRKQNQS